MTEEDNGRNPDGTFKVGNCANPEGRGAKDSPWQPFGARCKYWLNKMTRRELRELAMNEEAMDKLSSYDSMVITALVGAQVGKERGKERERVLDRIEGKPTQRNELTGKDGAKLFNDSEESVRSKLARLAAAGQTESDSGESK